VNDLEDNALLAQWCAGEARAGQLLFQRHFDRIYRFFETKCPAEADELAQSTFLAVSHAKSQFRGDASFRTYLFTIARNELYRFLRERMKQGTQVDLEVSSIAQLVSTPRTKIARNEDQLRLVEALRQLPVAQQTLLELHYWEEMGIAELAIIFECPHVTVRTRLHRARTAIKELLEQTAALEVRGINAKQNREHFEPI
jgi:RNA polymerase sigma factor (sigma-70 family)